MFTFCRFAEPEPATILKVVLCRKYFSIILTIFQEQLSPGTKGKWILWVLVVAGF